jgi:amidohydrolase
MPLSSEPQAAAFVDRLVAALEPELPAAVKLRRRLHAKPELAHAEYATAEAVLAALEEPAPTRAAGTGIIARLGPAGGGAVAVRAELDAILVVEQSGAPFSARGEAMHACGHDVHMAALVALYRAARSLESELPRPFVALFQPSEETHPSGARELVDAGALDGVASVVAAHVHPDVSWGQVSAGAGLVNASCDYFCITVEGRSGHAARRDSRLATVARRPAYGPDAQRRSHRRFARRGHRRQRDRRAGGRERHSSCARS